MRNAVDPERVGSAVRDYLADTRTTSGDHQNPTLLDVFGDVQTRSDSYNGGNSRDNWATSK